MKVKMDPVLLLNFTIAALHLMALGICHGPGESSQGPPWALQDELGQGALPPCQLLCPHQHVPLVQQTQLLRKELNSAING